MFFLKRNLPAWERAVRITVGFCPACAWVGRRYLDK